MQEAKVQGSDPDPRALNSFSWPTIPNPRHCDCLRPGRNQVVRSSDFSLALAPGRRCARAMTPKSLAWRRKGLERSRRTVAARLDAHGQWIMGYATPAMGFCQSPYDRKPGLQMSLDNAARRGWGRTAPLPARLPDQPHISRGLEFRFLSISTCRWLVSQLIRKGEI
jgi:hypothetical protein